MCGGTGRQALETLLLVTRTSGRGLRAASERFATATNGILLGHWTCHCVMLLKQLEHGVKC